MKKSIKKKVVIFSSYDDLKNPYYGGGGAFVIHETAKRLTKEFDVIIFTGNYPGAKNETKDGVRYQRIGFPFTGPKLSQLVFQVSLFKHVFTESFDIWIESFTPPFSTSFLPLLTKKPVIGLVHMLSGSDMKRKYLFPFQLIENFGLMFYKNFIVLNTHTLKKIQMRNKKAKMTLIPSGVTLPRINKNDRSSYLLFLGRIEINQKGLDLLLQSYSKIKDKIKIPLYIVGSGAKSEEKKLKILLKSLGLANEVKILGRANGAKKDRLYRNARLVVVPSRFETFSIAALEAMSYKKPVVGFDIAGLNWISKQSMVKVKPFEINGLSKALLKLSNDSKKRTKIGRSARNDAMQYSWHRSVQEYRSVIGQVVNSYA